MEKSTAGQSWPWLVAGVLPLAMPLSMPFVLLSSDAHPCPPGTFHWGTMGARSGTAGTVLLCVSCLGLFLLCFLRARKQLQAQLTWTTPLFCLSGGVALLGLVCCAYGATSWFCAMSRDVLNSSAPVPIDPYDELGRCSGRGRQMRDDEIQPLRIPDAAMGRRDRASISTRR